LAVHCCNRQAYIKELRFPQDTPITDDLRKSCSDSDNRFEGNTGFEGEIQIQVQVSGEVLTGEEAHFFLPFEVPAGAAEIEILHDTAMLAPQTARWLYESPPALESTARWCVGEFHSHTLEFDGSVTIDELVSLAESRGLDFVLMSEHNTVSQFSRYPALGQCG
tara:strand:- start:15100 stop:15591 length:492 start_codon:yes stop_codon:yes gene_type:complete